MAFSKAALTDLYARRARRYDYTSNLYYLLGLRMHALRKRAVGSLGLSPGDTVVELGCGTGLNFGLLQRAVGPSGMVIGVDISREMLDVACARICRNGWHNVTLMHEDVARFEFPLAPDGIISTFALTLSPEYRQVIGRGAEALRTDGRLTILDLKRPDGGPEWLVRSLAFLSRPFGVTLDLAERRPWDELPVFFADTTIETHWFGCVYLACASGPRSRGGTEVRRIESDHPRPFNQEYHGVR